MSMDDYTELQIDLSLIDKPQRVKILRRVTPRDLVQAIMSEFQDIAHLIRDPSAYRLVREPDGIPLDDEDMLLKQLGTQRACRLVEVDPPLPPTAQPMGRRIYLREQGSDRIMRLAWQPAIIGRFDDKLPNNELIACNLSDYSVSRRHAQILTEGQQVLIESLAPKNPLHVISPNMPPVPVNGRYPIQHGDTIELVRSQIKLQVIIL